MKHFVDLADFTSEEIWAFLKRAIELKKAWQVGEQTSVLQNKVLAMIFQKPSLRTRVSFEVGMLHLGGRAIYLAPTDIALGERESVPDIARVLSGYVDGIMARTFSHEHVKQLAQFATVPVINGLSDHNHPCQALADFMTILEQKGRLADLKLAYIGDGNNIARSLLVGAAKLGLNFAIATPPDYAIPTDQVKAALDTAMVNEVEIQIDVDPYAVVDGADIIYTDVWASMGQETEREKRAKIFPPYQVDDQLVAAAKSDVIVMHCLPAHRGEEISESVVEGNQSIVFAQAENRLHAQKGILAILMAEA